MALCVRIKQGPKRGSITVSQKPTNISTKQFLQEWDRALAEAKRTGRPGEIHRQDHMLDKPRLVGRTMHPSFMADRPPKHDPDRDHRS